MDKSLSKKLRDEMMIRNIVRNVFLGAEISRLKNQLRDANILLGYYRLYLSLIEPARRRSLDVRKPRRRFQVPRAGKVQTKIPRPLPD